MKRYEVYTKIDGNIVVIREFESGREAFYFAREMRRTTSETIYVREKGYLHFMAAF